MASMQNSLKADGGRIVPGRHGRTFLDQSKIQAGSRLRQQRIDLSALRRHRAAAEAGAFETRRGGGEPECILDPSALDQSQNEGAMEHIASAERVHGSYCEYRHFTDRGTSAVIPQHWMGPVGDGEK